MYNHLEKLTVFNYEQNGITFSKDQSVMINATEMAKPFGKRPVDWLNLPSTKEFIQVLTDVRFSNNVENQLVKTEKGGMNGGGGTWLHEDVAMEFARWLSPKFAIWCNDRIKELLVNGIVVNPNFANPAEAARAWADEYERRQKAESEVLQLTAKVEEMKPKASYYDTVLQAPDAITTTQLAADYGLSARTLNNYLKSWRVHRKINGQWVLYTQYVGHGYTQTKTHIIETPNGQKSQMWTYWTQKGRLFIYDLFRAHDIYPLVERNN